MKRTVRIGNLKVGGGYPVRIKGMLKGSLKNRRSLLKEAKALEAEGAQAIRVAVKDDRDSTIATYLKKNLNIPLVADIHFNYKLALRAIEEGFDGIRLNPLNITKKEQIREVARAAKKAKISIRVGVNSGGFRKKFSSDSALANAMVREASSFIRVLEKMSFFDIMVSLKAATPNATVLANRLFSKRFDYPLHLGITATGSILEGAVKSSIGIGTLLQEGIGDIIRVSLTADSFWEIRVAKYILGALGMRKLSPEIISCPTCSRCEVDLIKIVDSFQKEVSRLKNNGYKFPDKIAIMGCEVNGPGEACQADIGVAFGKTKGFIFKKDKIIATVSQGSSIKELLHKMGVNDGCKRN